MHKKVRLFAGGNMLKFESYQTEGFYDEMFRPDGIARPGAKLLQQKIASLSNGEL